MKGGYLGMGQTGYITVGNTSFNIMGMPDWKMTEINNPTRKRKREHNQAVIIARMRLRALVSQERCAPMMLQLA